MSVKRLLSAVTDVVLAALFLLAGWAAVLKWGLPAALAIGLLIAVGAAYAIREFTDS